MLFVVYTSQGTYLFTVFTFNGNRARVSPIKWFYNFSYCLRLVVVWRYDTAKILKTWLIGELRTCRCIADLWNLKPPEKKTHIHHQQPKENTFNYCCAYLSRSFSIVHRLLFAHTPIRLHIYFALTLSLLLSLFFIIHSFSQLTFLRLSLPVCLSHSSILIAMLCCSNHIICNTQISLHSCTCTNRSHRIEIERMERRERER